MHIGICDDEENVRAYIRKLIEQQNEECQITEYASGEELLQAEKENSENEKIFDDRHSWTKGRGDVTISGNVGSCAGRILAALEHGHKHPPPPPLSAPRT